MLAEPRVQSRAADDEAEAMRLLRRMKAEAALLIALADIGGVWPVMRVTAGAHGACRCGGRGRGAHFCWRGARAPAASRRADSDQPAARQRLHRARHGQDGRVRAQLFERYRPHRILRRGVGRAAAGHRAGAVFRAHHAAAGQAAAGAHRRRLRLPHRSAAAARSRPRRRSRSRPPRRSTITKASARTGNARR